MTGRVLTTRRIAWWFIFILIAAAIAPTLQQTLLFVAGATFAAIVLIAYEVASHA